MLLVDLLLLFSLLHLVSFLICFYSWLLLLLLFLDSDSFCYHKDGIVISIEKRPILLTSSCVSIRNILFYFWLRNRMFKLNQFIFIFRKIDSCMFLHKFIYLFSTKICEYLFLTSHLYIYIFFIDIYIYFIYYSETVKNIKDLKVKSWSEFWPSRFISLSPKDIL